MYFCCMCFLTTRRRCTPAVARVVVRRTGAPVTGAADIVVVGIAGVVIASGSGGGMSEEESVSLQPTTATPG